VRAGGVDVARKCRYPRVASSSVVAGSKMNTWHPRPEYQGYRGVLHGGLSATVLDKVIGYASILLAGIWAATATMDVRYRAQVPYDAPLPLVAGLTDTRGRRVRAWSRLHLPSGEVGAEATALLVALPENLATRARELYGPMA
ncbi:MAG: PaaI family thioesterase, partial [Actinomycetes bacterium]